MCGGTVRVFVHEQTEESLEVLEAVAEARATDTPVAIATLLEGERAGAKMAILADRVVGSLGVTGAARSLGPARCPRPARREPVAGPPLRGRRRGDGIRARGLHTGLLDPAAHGDLRRDRLLGRDREARRRDRLPGDDLRRAQAVHRQPAVLARAEVVVDWPDRYLSGQELGARDVALVFTHDPKFDEPALIGALGTDAGYIGALGSRRTQGGAGRAAARGGPRRVSRSTGSTLRVASISEPGRPPRRLCRSSPR